MFDAEGREVPGNRGYKYFGAAKDLPGEWVLIEKLYRWRSNQISFISGVRELFEQEPAAPIKKTRVELMKNIDADYYGYRDDDDDGILIQLEEKAERAAMLKAIEEWNEKRNTEQTNDDDDDDIYKTEAKVSVFRNFMRFFHVNTFIVGKFWK